MMKLEKGVKLIDATVEGNVYLHENVNVWYGTVIRSESERIEIGSDSNIQDLTVIHTDVNYPVNIGKRVTVGHRAILHGCIIEDEVMVGMGAIVMNGAKIGTHSIIGAGALIPEGKEIPPYSIVVGMPGKVIHQTSEKQVQLILDNAKHYVELAREVHD